jgi:hypothetical protein
MAKITAKICYSILGDTTHWTETEQAQALAQAWLDHEAQVASLRVQLTEAQVERDEAQREAHQRAVECEKVKTHVDMLARMAMDD